MKTRAAMQETTDLCAVYLPSSLEPR